MVFSRRNAPLSGLCVIERAPFADARGQFRRLFCAAELAAISWTLPVAQVNHSLTRAAGTVRGMHFQHPPHAEDKLVTCIAGSVWDVAVDLRAGSPTFLRWHAEMLSAENGRSMLIPKGVAHGFQAMSDDAALVYVHSTSYHPEAEGGLHPRDPRIGISWPLAIRELSEKDAGRPYIDRSYQGIVL